VRSTEVNTTKFGYVRCAQEETADAIEQVLVEYQRLLLVLFRGYQSVEDETVQSRSHKPDDHHCAVEIEIGPTRPRRLRAASGCLFGNIDGICRHYFSVIFGSGSLPGGH